MSTNPSEKNIPVEEYSQIIADTAPVMVWISGMDRKCLHFNEYWLHFTGRRMDEEVGDGWTEGIHDDDLELCLNTYNNSFDEEKEFKVEYRLKRADGEYRWILGHGVPRYNKENCFAGFIGSCIDIHEMKEFEDRKDEFINAASHELKTPITTMKVYVQMLQDLLKNKLEGSAPKYLAKVEFQIEKLTKLINNLLDLSKIQNAGLQLEKENFNLHDLIEEIVDSYRATVTSHKLKVTGKCNIEVYADRNRLSQVLINLLDNARKYSPHASQIDLSLRCGEDYAEVSIKDYGIGISNNEQKKIFQRFFRTEDVSKKSFPGLGIGLFLSMQIIRNHRGMLEVESRIGEGSKFTFTIPIR